MVSKRETISDAIEKTLATTPDAVVVPPPVVPPPPVPLGPLFPDPIPASALQLGDPNGDWFWHGYFGRHTTTLFSSLWKAGKTTLISHLLKAFGTGGLFCGRLVKPTKVLYVSEEPESMWARRRDKIGFGDHVHFQIRPFKMRPKMLEWVALIQHIRDQVEKHDFGFVVFDPLTTLWPVEKENEAGPVGEALMPLSLLTEKAGVGLVHHFRKSDGTEATGSRGSGVLPGYVDTIIEFRRYAAADRKDTRRVLSGWGRFEETPEEMVVELTDDGYIAHGDKQEVQRRTLLDVIRAILTTEEAGWDYDTVKIQLTEEMGGESPTKATILAALERGFAEGWIRQTGEGKRGDPKRYHRVQNPAPKHGGF
ncbi:MAG: hypothetical protein C0467_30050 [Planctomycetaceae bacterium]|nr:hypothetical protein [Planctomycetaceae bacterium]